MSKTEDKAETALGRTMIDASTCALRAAQTLRAAEDSPDSERAMALVAVADAWTRLVGTLALHSVTVFGKSSEPTDEEQLGPVRTA